MTRRQTGMTLIELIATLAMSAVVLALALPAMGGLLDRNQAAVMHNQITTAFSHARLLALTGRRHAVVCPSADRRNCRVDGIWDEGWITFVDNDADGRRDSNEEVLRFDAPDPGALHVRSSVHRSRARFRPNGMAYGSNLTLKLCNRRNEVTSALILNNAGRVRSGSRQEIAALAGC